MAATNTVAAPTSWVTSIFKDVFANIDWAEIANEVESRSINGAITTAEHVGEVVAGAVAAATGNPIALAVDAAIPAAESLVGVVINMVSGMHASGSPAAPAAASAPAPGAAKAAVTGRAAASGKTTPLT